MVPEKPLNAEEGRENVRIEPVPDGLERGRESPSGRPGESGAPRGEGYASRQYPISRRALTPTDEIEGGSDVFPKNERDPDTSKRRRRLPVLEKPPRSRRGLRRFAKIEEWMLPPGEMIPPHTHDREDECSYVLEGELRCYVGGEVVLAPRAPTSSSREACPTPSTTPAPRRCWSWRSSRRRRVRRLLRRV